MSTPANFQVPPILGQSTSEGEPSDVLPLRLGATIILLVAVADWLFFRERIGASVAVFGATLIACLVLNRPGIVWNNSRVAGLILIAGALFESVVEVNFFNFVVLALLFSAAMADQGAQAFNARPAVWPLAVVAAAGGLARW